MPLIASSANNSNNVSDIVPSSKGEYCVCMFPHCTQDHQVHEYYHSLNVFTIDSCIEQTSVDLGRIDATTQLGEYSTLQSLPCAVGQK